MNIKISNRLVELRKKNGYSQEELADKLGISRQAVSKWERAEASPDTDNLILLAKIYNVSLDELLNVDDEDVETIVKDNKEEVKGDEIYIDDDHIIINSKDGDKVSIKGKNITLNGKNILRIKGEPIVDALYAIGFALFVIIYILLGIFLDNGWAIYWPILLLGIVVPSIVDAIVKRKFTKFNYALFITSIYCFLGMKYTLWHPYWFLFITIPVYYIIFDFIDKLIHKDEKDDEDDDEDDD